MPIYKLVVISAVGMMLMSCAGPRFSVSESATVVGGRPAVTLSRTMSGEGTAQFLSVEILPGRGMNLYQLRAHLPGRPAVSLFEAPALEEAAKRMDGGPEDFMGNQSFRMGGAILVPYANRIRGKLLADGKTLETAILDKPVKLPANWKGRQPGAEPHAMHGLILASRMEDVRTQAGADHASVTGVLRAGDFGGQWLSQTDLEITANLRSDAFDFSVTAKNAGSEPLPMGIGWHPYFVFPSGQREQARLRIPARQRALVNNYDDVFPTGKLVAVKGSPYDFSASGGAPLGKLFLDDCFVDLERDAQGHAVVEVIDPAARYGLRITALSPEVSAFQIYAPVDKSFVALEPQFNWADPYSSIWGKGVNTGMVTLQPGQSVIYSVRLELFRP